MALKSKVLSFVAESFMFVGSNHDNGGKLGIVTFTDHCEMTKKARQLTDDILEDDKGYQLLHNMSKRDAYEVNTPLMHKAHTAETEIWSILFHKFLIDQLKENGWTIINANSIDFSDIDLRKNHMQI